MRNIHTLLLSFAALFVGLQSCEKNNVDGPDVDPSKERTVSLGHPEYTIKEGETIKLTPHFGSFETPKRAYSWTIEEESVLSKLSVDNSDFSITLKGLQPGTTKVTITSDDGSLHTATMIQVEAAPGLKNAPVFIGFGSEGIPAGWNAFFSGEEVDSGSRIADLVDYDGAATGLSIEIIEGFNDQNTSGPPGVTLWDIDVPQSVSAYSYFGNSFGAYGGVVVEQSKLKVSNLNKDLTYNFCFFASRGGVSDNRETDYIVAGANTVTASLNTSSNVNPSRTACAENVQPDENGEIIITVKAGQNNNNSAGFYYLGIIRLSKGN